MEERRQLARAVIRSTCERDRGPVPNRRVRSSALIHAAAKGPRVRDGKCSRMSDDCSGELGDLNEVVGVDPDVYAAVF
jgi:hypothetical protein